MNSYQRLKEENGRLRDEIIILVKNDDLIKVASVRMKHQLRLDCKDLICFGSPTAIDGKTPPVGLIREELSDVTKEMYNEYDKLMQQQRAAQQDTNYPSLMFFPPVPSPQSQVEERLKEMFTKPEKTSWFKKVTEILTGKIG